MDLASGESDTFAPAMILNHVEGTPILSLPVARKTRVSKAIKVAMDRGGAAAALVALSPLLAVCAAAIKLGSPGPVFFRQKRVGRERVPFYLFKFRSMVADADDRKSEVEALNMHAETDDPAMFKIPDDPRITRFGRFMRRWSLDELPQLLNVVRGEMSLVGPRPCVITSTVRRISFRSSVLDQLCT